MGVEASQLRAMHGEEEFLNWKFMRIFSFNHRNEVYSCYSIYFRDEKSREIYHIHNVIFSRLHGTASRLGWDVELLVIHTFILIYNVVWYNEYTERPSNGSLNESHFSK